MSDKKLELLDPATGKKTLLPVRPGTLGPSVVDIAPLAKLTQLETLSLKGTKVKDLSPLDGLKKLKSVDGRDTPADEDPIPHPRPARERGEDEVDHRQAEEDHEDQEPAAENHGYEPGLAAVLGSLANRGVGDHFSLFPEVLPVGRRSRCANDARLTDQRTNR
jgi:hypothetical protein